MTAPYRFALIGTGFFAQNHLHAWASEPWNAIQDSVYAVQRHWVHCLATGATPETSGTDTLRLLDITLGAYESLDTGAPYRVGSLS